MKTSKTSYGYGRMQVFSNGEDLILLSNGQVFLAKDSYIKRFDLSTNRDLMDVTTFGGFRQAVPTLISTNIDLSIMSYGMEIIPFDPSIIDQLLFKNKTILDLVKMTRQKLEKRESENER